MAESRESLNLFQKFHPSFDVQLIDRELPGVLPKASRTPALGALSHEPTSMLRLLLMTALIGHALGGGADLTVNQKEVRHGYD